MDLLRQKLSSRHPELEIKSVDGFQGREKEAVVLSLVRSNRKGNARNVGFVDCTMSSELVQFIYKHNLFINTFYSILGEVGFLAEDRRINVAVTRARRHVAVVCDTQTVQNHAFLKSLIAHMTEFGEVRTAFEYLPDIVPQNYSRDQKDSKTTSAATKQKVKGQPSSKTKQKRPVGVSRVANTAGSQNHNKTDSSSAPKEQQQDSSRYAEIREQVENFLKDLNRNDLQFPSSFNSHDRLLVHQISEELGLVHESKGEGSDRYVTVSRPVTSKPAEEQTQEEPQAVETQTEETQTEETVSGLQSEPSHQPSLDLKSLHLERMKREQQRREETAQQRKQQKNVAPAPSQPMKKSKGLYRKLKHFKKYVQYHLNSFS